MTPLERLVREEIERSGPLPVSAYVNMVLNDPAHGYYATRRPIGADGDFTTAPEVSQMFGELIAAWFAGLDVRNAALIEIGPGRGTLMVDMARTLRKLERRPTLHLVETSPSLRAEQTATLGDEPADWHESFTRAIEATQGPLLIVANELLDALPVRQFVRTARGWNERVVALIDGELAFAAGAASLSLPEDAPEGTILELAPAREALVSEIAAALVERGGAALLIDYGALDGGTGDTLQAIRRHERVDPLSHVGEADLTTHVDFGALRAVAEARGCRAAGAAQGAFLLELGLIERAGALGHARPERQGALREEVERLAGPDAMGDLFKVLALWHPSLAHPPGFGG